MYQCQKKTRKGQIFCSKIPLCQLKYQLLPLLLKLYLCVGYVCACAVCGVHTCVFLCLCVCVCLFGGHVHIRRIGIKKGIY